jgi:hypothetical protein
MGGRRLNGFYRPWKRVGFRPLGHLVWVKDYPSLEGFARCHHEQAYLLAKGKPKANMALKDVLECSTRATPCTRPRRVAISKAAKTDSMLLRSNDDRA